MKKILLSLTVLFIFVSSITAQERTVAGRVTSPEDELGLPGVTVIIKATSKGTVTDMDGNFTVSGVTDTDILVFSYIGFEPQEVVIGTQREIYIEMQVSAEELDEIYENLDQGDKAVALVEENIIADPYDSQSLLTLGYLHFRHNDLESARVNLEEHMKIEPDSYSGSVMLAKLYRAMGETVLAAAMIESNRSGNRLSGLRLSGRRNVQTANPTAAGLHVIPSATADCFGI